MDRMREASGVLVVRWLEWRVQWHNRLLPGKTGFKYKIYTSHKIVVLISSRI